MIKSLLIGLIKIYQKAISPFFAPSCRFHPTCSQYAIESLKTHGPVKGLWFSLIRILKCHPFHPGGLDPVRSK